MRGRGNRLVSPPGPVQAGSGSESEIPGDGDLDLLELVTMKEERGSPSMNCTSMLRG
jgi:hypothetical protein